SNMSSYGESKACYCDKGLGEGIDCCAKCGQYSCGQCTKTPGLVNTDQGYYCPNCLKGIVLSFPPPCDVCKCYICECIVAKDCAGCQIELDISSECWFEGEVYCRSCRADIIEDWNSARRNKPIFIKK